LGFLAMWLVYDLKPVKTRKIKEQLLELHL
jgi:hypothetical protein